eukprot:383186-Prorocentrum_minimum.AAC.3
MGTTNFRDEVWHRESSRALRPPDTDRIGSSDRTAQATANVLGFECATVLGTPGAIGAKHIS